MWSMPSRSRHHHCGCLCRRWPSLFAFAALVIWVQKVIQRYFQLQQLQVLTCEYVVKDLFALDNSPPQPSAPPLQQLIEPSSLQPEAGDLEAGSPGYAWVLATPVAVQQSVTRDLQAICGYRAF